MPQMAPLNWLIILLLTHLILVTYTMYMYKLCVFKGPPLENPSPYFSKWKW